LTTTSSLAGASPTIEQEVPMPIGGSLAGNVFNRILFSK
jgi:hypothetical protein